MKWAKNRFQCHRYRAKKRGIGFELTFEQWYQWWLDHGIDKNYPPETHNLGHGPDFLCMCRYNDIGPYALNNIYCATDKQNAYDRNVNKPMLGPLNPQAKPIRTPDGMFDTLTEAAKHYNVKVQAIYMRLRRNKKDYQYV